MPKSLFTWSGTSLAGIGVPPFAFPRGHLPMTALGADKETEWR